LTESQNSTASPSHRKRERVRYSSARCAAASQAFSLNTMRVNFVTRYRGGNRRSITAATVHGGYAAEKTVANSRRLKFSTLRSIHGCGVLRALQQQLCRITNGTTHDD